MDSPGRGIVCRNKSGSIQCGVPLAPDCSSHASDYEHGVWFGAVLRHPAVELLNAFDRRQDFGQMPVVEFTKWAFKLCRSLSHHFDYEIGATDNQGDLQDAACRRSSTRWRRIIHKIPSRPDRPYRPHRSRQNRRNFGLVNGDASTPCWTSFSVAAGHGSRRTTKPAAISFSSR